MNIQKFASAAYQAADLVDYMMVEEMQLAPPELYEVSERDGRVYMVATFNPLALGRSLKAYENPDLARRLRAALGKPVAITRKTGTRYVILLAGQLSLPAQAIFPGFGEPDVFRLGVGLRGPVELHARELKNAIIGASQGAGKSNVQALLVHQARTFGWKLYLADPDGHTFNPDVWNPLAAAPVASSPADLDIIIDRLFAEIADRVALFRAQADGGIPPADLDAYNKVAQDPLPRILLAVDEANTYLVEKKLFGLIADLLRRGRKWGLHIFLSGHEWHKDTVLASVNDMLQTRIGMAVATDQMGAVIMRSSHYGRQLVGKKPGRGILRTNKYQPVQFYLVTEEQEREWLAGAARQEYTPLSEQECEMVRYSLEQLDGEFPFRTVAEGLGIGEYVARQAAESWEKRGWLTSAENTQNGRSARRVTPKLAKLAGFDRTGALGALGTTGPSLGALGSSLGTTGLSQG